MNHLHAWRIGAPVRTTVVEQRDGFDAIGCRFGPGVTMYRVDECFEADCTQRSVTFWEGADAKLIRVETHDLTAALSELLG